MEQYREERKPVEIARKQSDREGQTSEKDWSIDKKGKSSWCLYAGLQERKR